MKYIGFRYVGGKLSKLDFLLKYVPKHKIYIEPFGGSGALLLNKPKSEIEIYNDLDHHIVNLLRVWRDHYDELKWRLLQIPYSEEEFNRYKEMLKENKFKDEIEHAVAVYYLLYTSFSAKMDTFSYGFNNDKKIKVLDERVRRRLLEVTILCRDALQIMDAVLKNKLLGNTFMYLDPPYLEETLNSHSKLYNISNHSKEFHEKMLNKVMDLSKNGVKILISGYDNNLYNDTLNGWNTAKMETFTSLGRTPHGKKRNPRTEKIWFNYKKEHKQLNEFQLYYS